MLSSVILIILMAKTTDTTAIARSTQTLQAFHSPPFVRSSTLTAQVGITTLSNQIQIQQPSASASCSVLVSLSLPSPSLSILKLVKNHNTDMKKGDPLKVPVSVSRKRLGNDVEQNDTIVVVPSFPVTQLKLKATVVALQDIKLIDIEKYNQNDWIDTQEITKVTDFPEEYFVRKQSIDIFKILKERKTKQIVLVGSVGVGKSLLLVLYSFWMAIEEKKTVLLVRQFRGENKGFSILFLNGQSPLESWKVDNFLGDIVKIVNQCREQFPNSLLCLDRFYQTELPSGFNSFALLATSDQFITKQSHAGVLDLCLVPFWSLSDSKLVGQHKNNWDDEEDMERKYYFSGGNLKLFLLPEKIVIHTVNVNLAFVDITSTKFLTTRYGVSAVRQADRIQMATLLDTNDLTNYRKLWKWSYAICSEYTLRKLGEYIPLEYYKDMCDNAYLIMDPTLFGIGFENYFHAMVREKNIIELMKRQY